MTSPLVVLISGEAGKRVLFVCHTGSGPVYVHFYEGVPFFGLDPDVEAADDRSVTVAEGDAVGGDVTGVVERAYGAVVSLEPVGLVDEAGDPVLGVFIFPGGGFYLGNGPLNSSG